MHDHAGHQTPDSFQLPHIVSHGRGNKNLPAGPGRTPGAINRITRDLKSGIIDAATAYGSDGHGTGGLTGYLFFLAGSHPKAFSSLLGKLLPLQVNQNAGKSVVGQINIVSIPCDRFLSPDDVRKLAPEPPVVEHEPQATEEGEQG